jgi:hypothetical protein
LVQKLDQSEHAHPTATQAERLIKFGRFLEETVNFEFSHTHVLYSSTTTRQWATEFQSARKN